MSEVVEKPPFDRESVMRANAFKPGQSGNPGGKPTGTRNELNGKFLRALITTFDEADEKGRGKGLNAIRKCRDEDPAAYVRALVALQPKELEVTRPLDDISDDQLAAAFAAVGAILAAQDSRAGDGPAEGAQSAPRLPAVPEAG